MMMAGRKIFKFAATTAIGGYTAYVLHQNDWNPRHIGLVRFGYAALTVGQIAVDYKYSVSHLRDDSDETLEKWSKCHERAAQHLLRLCSTNGGVFIKVGQHIAALDYLVPKAYTETLKVLHNQAPRSSFSEISAVIRKETGAAEIGDIFDEFDPQPLASASLAQVYRAKLRDTGEVVAVKVQHPKVFQHSLVDMATMEFLCSIVTRLFPEFSFAWLVEETKRNLPLELDFVNEAKNATNIATILKDIEWFKIPRIHWKYTTKRLLTMEFVDGKLITDRDHFIANRINTQEIVSRFEQLYGKMICIYGTVHCDPHPGNVLIKKTDDRQQFHLYLLDHGLYTQLTDDFRQNYCALWLAIFRGDLPEIKRTAKELGIEESNAAMLSCMVSAKPWSAIVRGLENRPTTADAVRQEKLEMRRNASRYMNQITQVLASVDRQMLLIMKTNDLIRYISNVLGCDERRSLLNMNHYCIEVCQQRKYRQAKGLMQKTRVAIETQFLYWRLSLYRFILWIDSWFHRSSA